MKYYEIETDQDIWLYLIISDYDILWHIVMTCRTRVEYGQETWMWCCLSLVPCKSDWTRQHRRNELKESWRWLLGSPHKQWVKHQLQVQHVKRHWISSLYRNVPPGIGYSGTEGMHIMRPPITAALADSGASPMVGGYFSPNSVSTLRGSYGRSKGRCLIRVLHLGPAIFPVKFRMKWLLWHVDVHFDCAGSHKVGRGPAFFHIFPVHFRIKCLALVTCWCAFRLRRLAQSLRRGSGERHFSCKFPYKVALVTCWYAFRLRRLAQSVGPASGGRHFFP